MAEHDCPLPQTAGHPGGAATGQQYRPGVDSAESAGVERLLRLEQEPLSPAKRKQSQAAGPDSTPVKR